MLKQPPPFYILIYDESQGTHTGKDIFPMRGPTCGGQMSIISFIEEPKTIDRIIRHLELTFEAEWPPPPHQQGFLVAAEEKEKYF